MESPVGQNREEILWFHSLLILKGPIDFSPHALLFVSLTLRHQGHTLLVAHHFHSICSADLGGSSKPGILFYLYVDIQLAV